MSFDIFAQANSEQSEGVHREADRKWERVCLEREREKRVDVVSRQITLLPTLQVSGRLRLEL